MMEFRRYEDSQPIQQSSQIDPPSIQDLSVIVTGGAKGIGEDAVRAFVNAGAFVTIGDIDEALGQKIVKEFPGKTYFVKCDIRSWEDQQLLFETARSQSPSKSLDIVVANAGISGADPIFAEDCSDIPTKPDLSIIDTNLVAALYTLKLARYHFLAQKPEHGRDRCIIYTSSLIGYLDLPGTPQYSASKWGLRGIMHSVRRTTEVDGIRINLIAPWYVLTPIMSPEVAKYLQSKNIEFAEASDAAKAMLRIASDRTINGRSLAIVPRSIHEQGFIDSALDDYHDNEVYQRLQAILLATSHRLVKK